MKLEMRIFGKWIRNKSWNKCLYLTYINWIYKFLWIWLNMQEDSTKISSEPSKSRILELLTSPLGFEFLTCIYVSLVSYVLVVIRCPSWDPCVILEAGLKHMICSMKQLYFWEIFPILLKCKMNSDTSNNFNFSRLQPNKHCHDAIPWFGHLGSSALAFCNNLSYSSIHVKNQESIDFDLLFSFLTSFSTFSIWSTIIGKELILTDSLKKKPSPLCDCQSRILSFKLIL